MKQYNIYKTTNLINGKFYWGVHNSLDENDGYFGTSTLLLNAIKKHGRENFHRTTKLLYKTAKEAYEDEAFIVDLKTIKRRDCYNVAPGGLGGIGSLPKSEKTKRKMSIIKMGENNPMFGKKHSEETKQIMRKPKSEEHKQKLKENHADFSGQNNPNSKENRLKRNAVRVA
jgi:group I intron endonuclease